MGANGQRNQGNRDFMSKKYGHVTTLPEFTVEDWLKAEQEARAKDEPKPKGVTADEYADIRGVSRAHAQTLLRNMTEKGVILRTSWRVNGRQRWVYNLKKNGHAG
jgi:hypothetical protein